MSPNKSVPHLSYVLVCDNVVECEDGKLNIEGLLSRFLYIDMPIKMPPIRLELKIVIGTYCEDESATHTILFSILSPDGVEADLGNFQVGYINGAYSRITTHGLSLLAETPGTYWLKFYLGSQIWGQYPLTISYLQMGNS